MIPGLAVAMRLFAALWFALAILWTTDSNYSQATLTLSFGLACFAYGEWLDRKAEST